MSSRPIMDAGPGLNFFSINKERLLFGVLGPLAIPEIVRDEILGKSESDRRFDAAQRTLSKLPERLLSVLSDDPTPELSAAVQRITGAPLAQRYVSRKDLGETMVIAHAVIAAESGADVVILIDEGPGTDIAAKEAERLRRMRRSGRPAGSIGLVSTLTVLERAAESVDVPDRGVMRAIYQRLREGDDGLPPLSATNLLTTGLWG